MDFQYLTRFSVSVQWCQLLWGVVEYASAGEMLNQDLYKKSRTSCTFGGILSLHTKWNVTDRQHRLISTRLPDPVFFLHSHHTPPVQYESSGSTRSSRVSQAGRVVGSFLTTLTTFLSFPFPLPLRGKSCDAPSSKKEPSEIFDVADDSSVGTSSSKNQRQVHRKNRIPREKLT
jgi:hypothetical protein